MGPVFERYELVEEIGRGGFGVVYKAKQLATGQDCAIKTLNLESLPAKTRPEQLERFKREMKLIGALRSPHIVRLMDFGVQDGQPFMVLEFVEGEPLSKLIERGPLAPSDVKRLLGQVLEALVEAHESGIIHRDLKPANIMVTRTGERLNAKVLDFGLAGIDFNRFDAATDGITVEGQISGTPAYMAPEQLQFLGKSGPRADLYSMGLIILECLTGQRAVTGDNLQMVCFKQATVPVEVPLRVESLGFAALVKKACHKDPELRFESANEMLLSLEDIDTLAAEKAELAATQAFGAQDIDPMTGKQDASPQSYLSPDIQPIKAKEIADEPEAKTSEQPGDPHSQLSPAPPLEEDELPTELDPKTGKQFPTLAEHESTLNPAPKEEQRSKTALWLVLVAIILVGVGLFFALAHGGKEETSTKSSENDLSAEEAEQAPPPPIDPTPNVYTQDHRLVKSSQLSSSSGYACGAFELVDPTDRMIDEALVLARLAYKEQKYEEALEYYQTVLELGADDSERVAEAHEGMGWTFISLNRFADAVLSFTKAVDLFELMGKLVDKTLFGLAISFEGNGQLEEALQTYNSILERFPDTKFRLQIEMKKQDLERELDFEEARKKAKRNQRKKRKRPPAFSP